MKKIIKKVIVTIGISCIVTAVAPTTITNPLVVNAEAAVKISAKSANMLMGQTKQLKLTGTKKKATWASSNKNIVKVSSTGKITAVRPGKATISAKVDGRKYTCIATVKEIKVDLPKNTIKEDTTMKMTITNTPIGFAAPVWSTSNGNATITKDGVVTGVKAGDCTIILQVGPLKYIYPITIKDSFSKEEALKHLTYTEIMVPGDPDNCHTFIIKNDYKYDLVAAITYKYYGESGNLLNLDRVNFRYIKAGEYCVATMEKSHKPDNCREEFVLGCSIITSSQDELAANNPFFGFKVSALDSFEKDTLETNTYAKTVVFENALREGWASYFLGRYYVFDPNANYIGTASFKNCDGEHPPYVIPPHEKVKYKLVVTLNNGCNINDAVILSQNGYNIPMIK